MSDHYATLGVGPEATPQEIEAAYRRGALERGWEDGFWRELRDAYDVLSDPEERARYDLQRDGAQPEHRVIALTPQGRQLTQELVEELAQEPALTLLSSRFEGFDERIVEHLCTDAISIGPYVLSGGELPAMVLVDALVRRLPGALAAGSGEHESFSVELDGGLEYPHYTRPAEFHGWEVPEVLLSGNHGHIEEWRREQSRARSVR